MFKKLAPCPICGSCDRYNHVPGVVGLRNCRTKTREERYARTNEAMEQKRKEA